MEKGTILIVDDDPGVLRGLYRLLKQAGYEVEGAATVDAGLVQIRQRFFDLVITDLQMPGKDGMEFLSEIKRRSTHTPVVMLTGYGKMEVVLEALRRGVNDFLTKPYQPEELLGIVKREVARHRQSLPPGMGDSLALQLTTTQVDEIDRLLVNLRVEINARCVLLIEGNGAVLAAKGAIEDLNISALGALVAGDFAATAGIATLIGEEDPFKLNFHEGEQYSVYSGQVVSGIYLLIVFSQDVRLGAVLYYTKDTLIKLKPIVENAVIRPVKPAAGAPVAAATAPGSNSITTAPLPETPQSAELLSFDELVNSGMLDEKLLSSLEEQFNTLWSEAKSE